MEVNFKRFLIVSLTLILGLPLLLYFANFNGPLSNDPAVWGTFGDYLNPFVSILNVAAFVYLTYIIQLYESRQEKRRAMLPILISAMDDLIRMEPIARILANKQYVEEGTFENFMDSVDTFSRKYFSFLDRLGIPVKELEDAFTKLNSVVVLPQPHDRNAPGIFLEFVVKNEHRGHIKHAAGTIQKYNEILRSHIQG